MSWKNVQYENGKYRTSEGGGGGGSSTFAGLDDVSFDNLQNGQVPKYNSDTHKWENADESGGGGTVTDVQVDGVSVVNQQGVAEIEMPTPPSVPSELSDLSDVQFSNLADHQPLRYNATSQKWENGADSFPPLIYSDEERVVGVWRDGKPLYQKTISFNISGGTHTTSLGVTNMGMCLMICAFKVDGTDSTFIPFVDIEAGSSIDSWSVIVYRANLSSGDITYRSASRFAGQTVYATFQYTKTSDTAGSGTWTTQGGYAHHYSTTEHVIGTWIDGKPLYEKTFQFSNYVAIPTKIWTTVMDVSNLSISKLVRCDFIDMEGVYWSGALNRISNGNLQSYVFEGWPVKELTLQYTKSTD